MTFPLSLSVSWGERGIVARQRRYAAYERTEDKPKPSARLAPRAVDALAVLPAAESLFRQSLRIGDLLLKKIELTVEGTDSPLGISMLASAYKNAVEAGKSAVEARDVEVAKIRAADDETLALLGDGDADNS